MQITQSKPSAFSRRSLSFQQFIPWLVPAGLILIWQVLSQFGVISTRILPAPTAIAQAAVQLTLSGELIANVGISLYRALAGFLIGGIIGFGLGLLNGISPIAERFLDSTVQMIRNIPHLALIPLVILWFGIGDPARLFLVALGVFFPIYINTFHGIRSLDPNLLEMGKVYGLRPRELFWQIILPSALPSMLVGLRYALGIMWVTLIVAETIAANSGIGYMAMNAQRVHANRCGSAKHFVVCPARQTGRFDRAGAGALVVALASKPRNLMIWDEKKMKQTEYQGATAHNRDYNNGAHLKVQNLSKDFGNFQVLKDISLEITPGEFVAFVGKSGCGKTTLLRLLGGLDQPTQGQIEQNGQVLHGLNRDARVMFQDSRLLPWRRVLENVSLGLKHRAQEQGQWALEQVGLGDRATQWITQLSGGQRQRVALARALVSQPRLLLLDEPLGALDALTRLGMQNLIETLWQEQGFTALLVTHDVEEAVYLADRVIVIEEGTITLNLPITLPRPRDVASVQFAELKLRILDRILDRHRSQISRSVSESVPSAWQPELISHS